MLVTSSERLYRPGTPLCLISRLVDKAGIQFSNFSPDNQGDTYISTNNVLPEDLNKNIRTVVYLGSPPIRNNCIQSNLPWDKISHVVFISKYFEQIVRSNNKISCPSSVINFVGGCPSDSNILKPNLLPRTEVLPPFNFMCCAKWWKRPFKRLSQVVHLFNNYILKKYPVSLLHVLGSDVPETVKEGKVIYYKKSHHDFQYVDVWCRAHVHISLSAFDTGPMTLNESLHYRVPFVYPNNCAAQEFVDQLGKCGEIVKIDPDIKTAKDLKKYSPLLTKSYYNRHPDYDLIMQSIIRIIDNFEEYTSWKWTDSFNYNTQINKWLKVLNG